MYAAFVMLFKTIKKTAKGSDILFFILTAHKLHNNNIFTVFLMSIILFKTRVSFNSKQMFWNCVLFLNEKKIPKQWYLKEIHYPLYTLNLIVFFPFFM